MELTPEQEERIREIVREEIAAAFQMLMESAEAATAEPEAE